MCLLCLHIGGRGRREGLKCLSNRGIIGIWLKMKIQLGCLPITLGTNTRAGTLGSMGPPRGWGENRESSENEFRIMIIKMIQNDPTSWKQNGVTDK